MTAPLPSPAQAGAPEGVRYLPCPFCGEPDFDLRGLKGHLSTGGCRVYDDTVSIYEWTDEELAEEEARRSRLPTPAGADDGAAP